MHGLKRSAGAGKVYIWPGNGGINRDAGQADIEEDKGNLQNTFRNIAQFCKSADIGLVVIGPEQPLVDGLADYLETQGIKAFGPGAKAAQIEGSKQFMKDAARKYGIPTAEYAKFSDAELAKSYIREKGAPIVVKTDGLAAGKGVTVAQTEAEALQAVDEMFGGKFGDAGNRLVIEEFLAGEEASFFAICGGDTAVAFGSAQDHKAVGDGDTGPNTGGMGTYSPAPVVTPALHERIMQEIIQPLIDGMKADGMPYKGVLFAGLMIEGDSLKLLEFNVRFGDPEAQVIIPRFEGDLAEIMLAACDGNLTGENAEFSDQTALCVVMAANGYPGNYQKGSQINNLEEAEVIDDVIVFHAGTRYESGQLLANGGRVLGVTALGGDILDAQQKAYKAVDTIDWPDGFCRRDIGWRAVKRLKACA